MGIAPIKVLCNNNSNTLVVPAGGSSSADCLPCPGGYYCQFDGQTQASGECSAGYYCPSNATITSPTPSGYECHIGFYCLQGESLADFEWVVCVVSRRVKKNNKEQRWMCLWCPGEFVVVAFLR